ncbi:MAG: hypothetical protein C4576_11425 [Desulfobacteraceae bacterium]|nr:MAG: hypothetical protein C4576_11425 [Desulfobacteraceae bacterium]
MNLVPCSKLPGKLKLTEERCVQLYQEAQEYLAGTPTKDAYGNPINREVTKNRRTIRRECLDCETGRARAEANPSEEIESVEKVKCVRCKDLLPKTENNFYRTTGGKYFDTVCKNCRRFDQTVRYAKRKGKTVVEKQTKDIPEDVKAYAPDRKSIGMAALQELEKIMDEKVSQVREIHQTALLLKREFDLDYTVKMPRMV